MYCEPGVLGPGQAWVDASHLELTGYAEGTISAYSDSVMTLVG